MLFWYTMRNVVGSVQMDRVNETPKGLLKGTLPLVCTIDKIFCKPPIGV